jgi:hypothetical protein
VKVRFAGIFLIFIAAIMLPSVLAAGITITSNQTDYYYVFGQIATIALPVSNTYPDSINGTLRYTTITQLQNTGNILDITKNSVYPKTFPVGNSTLYLNAGTSNVSQSIKIQVAFQYMQSTPILVTLKDLNIHFGPNLSLYQDQQSSPATSTSGAGLPGGLGNNSVQFSNNTVQAQQQVGMDLATSYSPSSPSSSQNNQLFQDTSSLKAQIDQATAQKGKFQNNFNKNLDADPLVRQVNAILAVDGFYRQSEDTNPTDDYNGTFTLIYRNITDEQVNLQGFMSGGVVPFVGEQSFTAVNVTLPLNTNATYLSFSHELAERDFQRNQTFMNLTLTSATVNVTYLSGRGNPAYLNARVDNGTVTLVSLDMADSTINYLLFGMLSVVLILLALGAWRIYRHQKTQKKGLTQATNPLRPAPELYDYRKDALNLLGDAEKSFTSQNYKNAYSLVSRAIRIFLSYEQGVRRELTNTELEHILPAADHATSYADIMAFMEQCTDVEFAKGLPDAGEFSAMIRHIRAFVSANHKDSGKVP